MAVIRWKVLIERSLSGSVRMSFCVGRTAPATGCMSRRYSSQHDQSGGCWSSVVFIELSSSDSAVWVQVHPT